MKFYLTQVKPNPNSFAIIADKYIKPMSKHLDYVEQPDGTFKWELAEIPAVKSTPVETNQNQKQKKFQEKTTSPLSD